MIPLEIAPKHLRVCEEQFGDCDPDTVRAILNMKFPAVEQVRLPCRSRIMQAMRGVMGKIAAFSRKIAH